MFLRTELLVEKHFVGMSLRMSFEENRTKELWQAFMQRRNEIENRMSAEYYSVNFFGDNYFEGYNPAVQFVKCAAAPVEQGGRIPQGMEEFVIQEGLYAVFLHRGAPHLAPGTFAYIFQDWLPSSGYRLDNRPHFEILGEKYKNNHPDSEEEVWIPVKPAGTKHP